MNLFLSRLILNPRSRQVWSELAQPYEMHRTLMRAFPKATDDAKCKARDEFGVLFRAEVVDLRGVVKVYVQSRVEPNWSFLDGLNDYLCADMGMPEYEYKDIMPACRKIQNGQVVSFRLRANPTKKTGSMLKSERLAMKEREAKDPKRHGRRVPVRPKEPGQWFEAYAQWLVARSEAHGFRLVEPLADTLRTEDGYVYMNKTHDSAKGQRLRSVTYDGLLEIVDPTRFREALASGIGPGKAFGFGLLSIAPA